MLFADLKDIAPILSGAIGAVATLLAVVVTSFFNFKVTKLNLDEQRHHRSEELKLEKLEELFLLFDKWQLNFSTIYLCYLRCYRGKLKFNEVLETVKGFNFLTPGDAQKYKMIMEVHFPSLKAAYAPVEEARSRIAPFLTDPAVNKLSAKDFESVQVAFEEASKEFKSCISSLAHESRI
jgi:hypothetical protein